MTAAQLDVAMRALEQELLALVDEPQHGLVTVDPVTGEQEHHGVIIKKRTVTDITVWLTYSKADRIWWIAWERERLLKLAYAEARRVVCWQTFFELTEMQMRALEQEAIAAAKNAQ